jgi:hypothetical protein
MCVCGHAAAFHYSETQQNLVQDAGCNQRLSHGGKGGKSCRCMASREAIYSEMPNNLRAGVKP